MRRAIELARKARGFTSPNPLVGAVIVKGGEIVGEGFHRRAGADHAEIAAIKQVMKGSGIKSVDLDPALFHNATLYVTLEPCSHTGKTPPCSKAIVLAGFRKVCIGMRDPFKSVNGRGIKYLKENGIEVEVCRVGSDIANEIRIINQSFIKFSTYGLPYVALKAGASLDGKIATATGESKWITSEIARSDARIERSLCDAVLVGAGTVVADDPELKAVGNFSSKKILRVIVDPTLKLSLSARVFGDENVLVAYCSDLASAKKVASFEKAKIPLKSFGAKRVAIPKLLKYLAKRGIQSLFVEGGSGVHGAFCDAALLDSSVVDRVVFYLAPKLIGGKHALSVIGGQGVQKLSKSLSLIELNAEKIATDLKLSGLINLY